MAYGIKMFNDFGVLNLADDSKALRLHDSGVVSVPARTGTLASPPITPGSIYVNITAVDANAIVEIIDRDTTITAVSQLSIDIRLATVVNNHFTQVLLSSFSLSARIVMWKVWVHI